MTSAASSLLSDIQILILGALVTGPICVLFTALVYVDPRVGRRRRPDSCPGYLIVLTLGVSEAFAVWNVGTAQKTLRMELSLCISNVFVK
jgi:hypothetical protein